jgi:hypothetical protein
LVAWRAEHWQDLWAQGRSLDQRLQRFQSSGSVAAWSSLSTIGAAAPPRIPGFDPKAAAALFQRYGLALKDFAASAAFLHSVAGQNASVPPGSVPSQTPGLCERTRRLPELLQRFILCEQGQLQGIAWVQTPDTASARRVREQLRGALNDAVVVNPRLAVEATVAKARGELWRTVGIAAGLVFIILLVFWRKILAVGLVALPMALGLLSTAGIMGWAGVHLNIFNFIVLPMLVGIGLDDGIHVLRRFAELGRVPATLATTGRSILVTTLTTICGFGSLSLADYHVLQSMGLLAIAGVGACFFFSVTVLPAMLQLGLNRRFKTGSVPAREPKSEE